MTSIRAAAPAKINLGLEVVGRREDGYHEIATIFQTIDLCDTISVAPSDHIRLVVDDPILQGEDNLVLRAAQALQNHVSVARGAAIHLGKRIPAAAGLGGASSDAAATLRILSALWEIEASDQELHELALNIGSDVPFFLTGGTAFGAGRGEVIQPLGRQLSTYLILAVPTVPSENKTATMFRALETRDFTSGSTILALSKRIEAGETLEGVELPNAFARHAYERWPELTELAAKFAAAGAKTVALSGAGPSLYSIVEDRDEALTVRDRLAGRVDPNIRIFLCSTVSHISPPVRDNR